MKTTELNNAKIIETEDKKVFLSKDYNYVFNSDSGLFYRWGKSYKDDPQFSSYGPEILDLEISSGKCNGRCKFCYKGNGEDENTHHMTLDEFKSLLSKMPKTLTQIAFGICDISSNPDFFAMMEHARENGVVPNYTCNGLEVTEEVAKKTASLCGAISVSLVNKKSTYNAIGMFLKEGMKQVNMHYMLSDETYEKAFDVIDDLAEEFMPKGFNAIVFLQYKPKGKNPDAFHSVLDVEKYTKLISYCNEKGINYGFDSCSAPMFLNSIDDFDNKDHLEMLAEPCESGLFSSYINCYGKFFVCSFAEEEDQWQEGIEVLNCDDFLKDVWMNPRLVAWRERLLENKRECPIYNLSMEKV
jgi:MoaA/NifB/PqqE/SkfB family radical SAM enzyme